jgi:hypothetical protein
VGWESNFKHLKEQMEPFFENLNLKKGPIVLSYPFYFLFRRLLLAFIVVKFREHLFFQILLTVLSVIVGIILNGYIEALESSHKKNVEYLNEVIIMCVLYSMICFSPMVPDLYARF